VDVSTRQVCDVVAARRWRIFFAQFNGLLGERKGVLHENENKRYKYIPSGGTLCAVDMSATGTPFELAQRHRYNLQAALDDPVAGAQFDWPLRLIARHHMASDVAAPVLFRVCKKWEYCWRLAAKTTEIDVRADRVSGASGASGARGRALPGAAETQRRRALRKQQWMVRGFEVRPVRPVRDGPDGPDGSSVGFLGAIEVDTSHFLIF